MSGSTATPGGEAGNGDKPQKYPWQLIAGGLAWATLGVTSLVVALSGGSGSEADAASVGTVQSSLGKSAAAVGEKGTANAAVLVLIGLGALLLTGLLMLGQGWARLALSAVGAVAVVYFALSVGFIPTFIAMAALVAGSALLLFPASVNRYLAG
jgi:hypothetical protein